MKYKHTSPVERQKIIELYLLGNSLDKVADQIGKNRQTVANQLEAEGIKRRSPGFPKGTKRPDLNLRRENNPRWTGGRIKGNGKKGSYYWMVWDERKAGPGCRGLSSYTPEHVLIAEKVLGRPLRKGEVVHHINGDKLDNRNSNLLICSNAYHSWLHQEMVRRYMKEHFPSPGDGKEILTSRGLDVGADPDTGTTPV